MSFLIDVLVFINTGFLIIVGCVSFRKSDITFGGLFVAVHFIVSGLLVLASILVKWGLFTGIIEGG